MEREHTPGEAEAYVGQRFAQIMEQWEHPREVNEEEIGDANNFIFLESKGIFRASGVTMSPEQIDALVDRVGAKAFETNPVLKETVKAAMKAGYEAAQGEKAA